MNFILLTQNSTPVIGQVAWLLGKIMNGIFYVLDMIGIPNVGIAIILFTVVVNLLMMPLTIKQQKFSKLSAKMNPEIQAIRDKYKNRTDNDSMMAQNQEVQAVYAKYGVSASGSCVQLLIQMPILFALYKVIYSMPAYVTKIGATFRVLAEKIISVDGGAFLQDSGVDSIANTVTMYGKAMTNGSDLSNGIIDVLNKLSSVDLSTVAQHYDLTNLTYEGQLILSNDTTRGLIDTYNNFLGLNMGDSPSALIRAAWTTGAVGIIIGAIMIPVLSMVTQWINIKLMPQQDTGSKDSQASSMAQSMKTMNMIMPIMSAFIAFSVPAGLGVYWIATAVFQTILQVLVNRHYDKMGVDAIVAKNVERMNKKRAKKGLPPEKIAKNAVTNTKKLDSIEKSRQRVETLQAKKEANDKKMKEILSSTEYYKSAKPGSLAEKAGMVARYNEKNKKNTKK